MAEPSSELNPLQYFADYQKARWTPAATSTEDYATAMELSKLIVELTKTQQDLRMEAIESWTTTQVAMTQSAAKWLAASAEVAGAQAANFGAWAQAQRNVSEFFNEAIKYSTLRADPDSIESVKKSIGAQGLFSEDVGRALSQADGVEDPAQRNALIHQALTDDNGIIKIFGGAQAFNQAVASLKTLPATENKVATAVEMAKTIGSVLDQQGVPPEVVGEMQVEMSRQLAAATGIDDATMNAEMKRSWEGTGVIEKYEAAVDSLKRVGMDPRAEKALIDSLGRLDRFSSPEAYIREVNTVEVAPDIQGEIDELKAQRDKLLGGMDPYDSAKMNFINTMGRDKFFAFANAMGFKGPHKEDRAVLYAARNALKVRAFMQAVDKDPALIDMSNGVGHIQAKLDQLGMPPRGKRYDPPVSATPTASEAEADAAKAADWSKNPVEAVAGAVTDLIKKKPVPEVGVDRGPAPGNPVADEPGQAAGSQPGAAQAAPDVPATEAKPTGAAPSGIGAPGAGVRVFAEGKWVYYQRPDGSIQIASAPPEHAGSQGRVYKDGAVWSAITDHINSGAAPEKTAGKVAVGRGESHEEAGVAMPAPTPGGSAAAEGNAKNSQNQGGGPGTKPPVGSEGSNVVKPGGPVTSKETAPAGSKTSSSAAKPPGTTPPKEKEADVPPPKLSVQVKTGRDAEQQALSSWMSRSKEPKLPAAPAAPEPTVPPPSGSISASDAAANAAARVSRWASVPVGTPKKKQPVYVTQSEEK